MPRLTSVRFGVCEINVAQRELRLHGELRAVHHRAFDLLVCLLERHDEVVPKAELCRVLWGGRPVSANMLAKTVMLARQAIDDDATEPTWIKTVSRVGYRLVAELAVRADDTDPLGALPTRAPPSDAATLRLALLPLENCTGDPQLAWIEHGMTALVDHALGSQTRLTAVPMEMVKAVLGEVRAESDLAGRAAELRGALDVDYVVQASLHAAKTGLRLDYRGHGVAHPGLEGSLSGNDAAQLGDLLARRLIESLLPTRDQTVQFHSGDPLFNQLFARALQCYMQRQARDTITYLRAAILLDPQSISARLLLLNAMIRCGDKAASATGRQLLDEARARADERLEGMVHEALMDLMFRGNVDVVREHARCALAIAARYSHESWALRVHSRAGSEATTRDNAEAIAQYELIRKERKRAGDQMQWTIASNNLATVRLLVDDLPDAQALFEEVVAASRHHHWQWLQAVALSGLSHIHLAWGRVSIARHQQSLADALSTSLQDDLYVGGILEHTAAVHAQTGDHAELGRLLRRAAHLRMSQQPMPGAYVRMVQGVRAALRGRVGAARRWMRKAIDLASGVYSADSLKRWLVELLLLELKAGQFDHARAVCRQIQSLHFYAESSSLRLWVQYAQAAELHAEGQAGRALDLLVTALKAARPGQADAHARLAAAWLCFEQDRLPQAVHLMQPIGPWLEEHPFGLSLAARLCFEHGDFARAVTLQRSAASTWPGRTNIGPLLELLSTYQAAAAAQDAQAATTTGLTVLPRLLTLL